MGGDHSRQKDGPIDEAAEGDNLGNNEEDMMYMSYVNAAAGNCGCNPYDVILSCKLGDLCDDEISQKRGSPGQWTCTFNRLQDLSFPMDKWAGHVVGILGQYNRGKTWIMSRLSNCQLAKEGMTVRTEGISLKWVETTGDKEGDRETDKFHHLVIDTAGFNTPITLSGVHTANQGGRELTESGDAQAAAGDNTDDKRLDEANSLMQEMEQYEQFLQSMTFALSDYVIVVLHETTLSDQRFLIQVVRKWKECSQDGRCKEIFVLHNFRDMHDPEEREKLFAQCTKDILDGGMDKKKGVSWFTCPILHTRHVCLMNDDRHRDYNDAVFDLVKEWIHNILPKPQFPYTPEKLARQFAKSSTELLSERGFLTNVKEIRHTEENGKIIYTAVKSDDKLPVAQLWSDDDKFYSPLLSFRPAYSIRTYRSEAGSDCKLIRIEAPGAASIKVKPKYNRSSAGHWAVEVSGEKVRGNDVNYVRELKGQEVEFNPRLKPTSEKKGEHNKTELDADSCRYGQFSELFQIPLKFKKPHFVKIGPDNGIFYLLFEEEEELDGQEVPQE
ncbi:uncharacterized protein LOC134183837 isoform X1 [Corticium candelabrum]|uniref:uncharacterized protein LOC134183837 isoform X1 n=1 Tax=Corticium candelabrum TaxID=121492 RepID=UPI002E25CCFF|nr:uncharacterized protein LOC134183837 isoform X1 [Corticium candelabrum]